MAKKKSEYGTPNLEKTPRDISLNVRNRKVADVVAEFERISIHGDHLAANDGDLFEDKRRFRYTHVNRRCEPTPICRRKKRRCVTKTY